MVTLFFVPNMLHWREAREGGKGEREAGMARKEKGGDRLIILPICGNFVSLLMDAMELPDREEAEGRKWRKSWELEDGVGGVESPL